LGLSYLWFNISSILIKTTIITNFLKKQVWPNRSGKVPLEGFNALLFQWRLCWSQHQDLHLQQVNESSRCSLDQMWQQWEGYKWGKKVMLTWSACVFTRPHSRPKAYVTNVLIFWCRLTDFILLDKVFSYVDTKQLKYRSVYYCLSLNNFWREHIYSSVAWLLHLTSDCHT